MRQKELGITFKIACLVYASDTPPTRSHLNEVMIRSWSVNCVKSNEFRTTTFLGWSRTILSCWWLVPFRLDQSMAMQEFTDTVKICTVIPFCHILLDDNQPMTTSDGVVVRGKSRWGVSSSYLDILYFSSI